MSVFWKIWLAPLSLNTRFKIRPFALLPTNFGKKDLSCMFGSVLNTSLRAVADVSYPEYHSSGFS